MEKDHAWWKFRLAVLDVTSAAAELRVSREYIRRLIREDRIRGVRVGQVWAIDQTSWEAFKRKPRRRAQPSRRKRR